MSCRRPKVSVKRQYFPDVCRWNSAQRHRISVGNMFMTRRTEHRGRLDSRRLCRRRPLGFSDIKSHPFCPCRRRRRRRRRHRVRDARTKSRLLVLRAALDRKCRTSDEIRLHVVECVAWRENEKEPSTWSEPVDETELAGISTFDAVETLGERSISLNTRWLGIFSFGALEFSSDFETWKYLRIEPSLCNLYLDRFRIRFGDDKRNESFAIRWKFELQRFAWC